MTNFERLMACKTQEEFTYAYCRLKQYAIYANGRLLDSSPSDFMEWLNKESDVTDINTAFNMKLNKCPKCGSNDIQLVYINDNGEVIKINKDSKFNYCFYKCMNCNHAETEEERVISSSRWPKNQIEALLVWNMA